jgi:hypothetical protein
MEQLREYTQQNSGMITSVIFMVLAGIILYVVYSYLYPADDPAYVLFMDSEKDSRVGNIPLKNEGKTPAIFTGGDFTLSFWIYVDDWNYNVARYKPLFNLGPRLVNGEQNRSVLTGLLTPYQNSMIIRGATDNPPTAIPDITVPSNRISMLAGQTSAAMFQNTVDAPCDIKDVPLQRWTCVTIVSNGRTLDVYMNGKLSRSCVLDSLLQIPNKPCYLSLGTFGGRYATVQMWNTQLTPDVIHSVYMMGPSQAKHNIITDITKYLGLNVTFTGSIPGQVNAFTQDPFAGITNALTGGQAAQSVWSALSGVN